MRSLIKTAVVALAMGVGLSLATMAISYGTGAGSCTYPSPSAMSPSQAGTGGFSILVEDDGGPVSEYIPGNDYTVTLSRSTTYSGFLLQSVAGDPGAPNVSGVGSFAWTGNVYQNAVPCLVGASSVTHNSSRKNSPQSSDIFTWTAPAASTGSVTFHAVGVVGIGEWYGQSTLITITLTEGTATPVTPLSWSTLKAPFEG